MRQIKNPELSKELYKRIKLVRRDLSGLLIHFTRKAKNIDSEQIVTAFDVLKLILESKKLKGTSKWTNGHPIISFTEAPIQEFVSIFSLNQIASENNERPRYEPYGVAVTKEWLYEQGGRPVIYEKAANFQNFDESQQYRLTEYDPDKDIDYTWEREWRIRTDELNLDPRNTLVIVPTSTESFDLISKFTIKADWHLSGSTSNSDVAQYWEPIPTWMAVSLDLFGLMYE